MDLILDLDLDELTEGILNEFVNHLNPLCSKIIDEVEKDIHEILTKLVTGSPEYLKLLNIPRPFGEIGQPDLVSVLIEVMESVANAMEIKLVPFRRFGDYISGGIEYGILRKDFLDVLSVPGTVFQSTNTKGTVTEVPWMEWLLFSGPTKVISDYKFIISGKTRKYSRTDTGIMIKSERGWSVPVDVAGTNNDNWIIRAMEGIDKIIMDKILEELSG